KRKTEWREEIVNQYGYQVEFSVQNRTEKDQTISIRAGLRTRNLIVPASRTLTRQTIQAARGSTLLLMVGGHSKSFEVDYGEKEEFKTLSQIPGSE
ncbi:MAG: hypothetical protein AAF492_08445, partial [Verrucomicrobiota bacterium]